MKISFGGGHDHASLVSSPTPTGDAPCLWLRSGDEDSMLGQLRGVCHAASAPFCMLQPVRTRWHPSSHVTVSNRKSATSSSFMYGCVDGCISSVSRDISRFVLHALSDAISLCSKRAHLHTSVLAAHLDPVFVDHWTGNRVNIPYDQLSRVRP